MRDIKVATCFYGQPRHLDRCWPTIKACVIDSTNSDVFFHFWSSPPSKSLSWAGVKEDTGWSIDQDDVVSLLNPKDFIFQEPIEFDISLYPEAQNPQLNVMSFFYSVARCHSLYNLNDYDVVIHCRSDLLFREPLKLESLEDDTIYLEHRGTPGDQFAYGTATSMKKFAELWGNFGHLYAEVGYVHAETMLAAHLKNKNLTVLEGERHYEICRHEQ